MVKVIKIGGAIVDDPNALGTMCDGIAKSDCPVVLVHGGGRIATTIADKLGISQQMVDGRRVTDADTLQVVTMTYAGWINKSIVAQLNARGTRAVGVCGADGNFILAKRRNPKPIDFGFVGDPVSVNKTFTLDLLAHNNVLVVAPITHDGNGTLLNTNADTIAAEVAITFGNDADLIYVFEHLGVLKNVNDPLSVINELSEADVSQMEQGKQIHTGMLPKLKNAFRAANAGVRSVRITNVENITTDGGTWCR